MNMSFINRASPHEVLSFFTQPIYPSAKDWLTMDGIQSAIMTSSLINLPHAKGEPGLQFGPRTHTHAEATVSVISRHFFSSLWDHGKVFRHSHGVALGMAVLVGRSGCRLHAGPEWNISTNSGWIEIWCRQLWFRIGLWPLSLSDHVAKRIHNINVSMISAENTNSRKEFIFNFVYWIFVSFLAEWISEGRWRESH